MSLKICNCLLARFFRNKWENKSNDSLLVFPFRCKRQREGWVVTRLTGLTDTRVVVVIHRRLTLSRRWTEIWYRAARHHLRRQFILPERNTHARGLRSPREARARAQIASSAVVVVVFLNLLDPDFARPYANTNASSLMQGRLPRLIAPDRPLDTKVVTRGSAGALTTNTRILFSAKCKKSRSPNSLTHPFLCGESKNKQKANTRSLSSLAKFKIDFCLEKNVLYLWKIIFLVKFRISAFNILVTKFEIKILH